jgi:hypothetical protein
VKFFCSILFLILAITASSQNIQENTFISEREAVFSLNAGKLSIVSPETARIYLKQNLFNLKPDIVNLEVIASVEAQKTIHYTFNQTIEGKPVYSSNVKVNLSKSGEILSLFDNSFPAEIINSTFPDGARAGNFIHADITEHKLQEIYFPSENGLVAALQIQMGDKESNAYEIIIDANGNILQQKDLNIYFASGKDSIVKAGVFMPNPIVSAGVVYGPPYIDSNDQDVPELIAEIKEMEMVVQFQNDTFRLESSFAKITEHSSPATIPAFTTIPEFLFTRSQHQFEDVNVFYHINHFQHYIRSLGFDNLANYQIHIDAHAHNGADQSSFSPFFTPHRLNFGIGGVDDGEDAHVIIHEYAHALSESAAPSSNSGSERQALDEGLADYFAVSYSKSINPHDWQKVFSWDGHNSFWTGRNAAVSRKYPQGLTSSIHTNGEIWSSTIMQIQGALGREITDILMLQTMYSFSANIKMSQAAQLFIQADELLYEGEHKNTLCYFFSERGLFECFVNVERLQKPGIEILNSAAFASGTGNTTIVFPEKSDYFLSVFDLSGKNIQNIKVPYASNYELSPNNFEPGIYLFLLESHQISYRFKLVKY